MLITVYWLTQEKFIINFSAHIEFKKNVFQPLTWHWPNRLFKGTQRYTKHKILLSHGLLYYVLHKWKGKDYEPWSISNKNSPPPKNNQKNPQKTQTNKQTKKQTNKQKYHKNTNCTQVENHVWYLRLVFMRNF